MKQRHKTDRLGELLKSARLARGWTLSDVGDKLQLANGNFIGMVERGQRMPSDDRMLQLADVLGLDGRSLLAIKYEDTRPASDLLFSGPDAELPRLRALLLDTCADDDREQMEAEFGRSERGAIERLVFQAMLEYVVLPSLERDKTAPRRLRDRVLKHLRRSPADAVDPWWFEEEAEPFSEWVRSEFVSWSFALPTLTLRIRHSPSAGDVSTIPLIDRELRERMLTSVQATAPGAESQPVPLTGRSLADLLHDEGLGDDDVQEILELIEFKKLRAARAARSAS